jgi:hypothetical protein
MQALVTSLLAGWVTLGGVLQSAADFSGQWTIEPDATATEQSGGAPRPSRGDAGSGWGSSIAIIQDGRRLVVEYTPFARYDMQRPLRLEYALDGADTRNTVMIGHTAAQSHSRSRWLGPVLEITTTHEATHPVSGKPLTTEVIQRLSLTSPGELLVETTRTVAGAAAATTRTTYKKNTSPR